MPRYIQLPYPICFQCDWSMKHWIHRFASSFTGRWKHTSRFAWSWILTLCLRAAVVWVAFLVSTASYRPWDVISNAELMCPIHLEASVGARNSYCSIVLVSIIDTLFTQGNTRWANRTVVLVSTGTCSDSREIPCAAQLKRRPAWKLSVWASETSLHTASSSPRHVLFIIVFLILLQPYIVAVDINAHIVAVLEECISQYIGLLCWGWCISQSGRLLYWMNVLYLSQSVQ